MPLLMALTTVATQAQAQDLARALVEARLAACVQLHAIESIYRWQGAVQQEPEWRLLIKTTLEAWPALRAAVLARHPYDTPALLAWPAEHASDAFAAWVNTEVGPAS
ncbi:MAG: divalent-cation tolerance protein CutA [Inhella sp.]|jgi:periplasmic divalent cation tolerance protein|uniref:divalent-cation tolerance protein CutA n=1 Tax=Inhella sp. TaxID=1921806 RepID=UPI0022C72E9C|nr:divalent-cation tolerance protein CutA [Inhella sp.]MCZ8235498.1 divalent-cation tolerance protein CutA [Inhella sp.]